MSARRFGEHRCSRQVLLAGVAIIYSPQTLAAALQFYERLMARIQPDQRAGGDAWLAAGMSLSFPFMPCP